MRALTAEKLLLVTAKDLAENISRHAEDFPERIAAMVAHLNLLDYWIDKLTDIPTKIILQEIGYDLLSSIYISSNGMYRNAYISLRSAIELGIGFFYFTDNNYDFLQWKRNKFDLTWSRLNDSEKGVLSKKYLSIFKEDFQTENYIEVVGEIYRECSEYVHGKYAYMHSVDSQRILFNGDKFLHWSGMFLKLIDVLLILLVVRFGEEVEEIDDYQIESLNEIFKRLDFRELIIENEH